jgi:hypothetical protein
LARLTLLDYFPRAVVINLPERTDRRADVERELASVDMTLAPGRVEVFPGIRPTSAGEFPSVGVRGCYLSHLGVLRAALEQGAPSVLVFEDDVTFSPLLRERADDLVRGLVEREWDFFYLGHLLRLERVTTTALGLAEWSGPILLAHAYAVHGRVLPRLVAFLEAALTRPAGSLEGGPMFPDGALNFFRAANPDVRTLVASPSLASQRSSRSDITPRWFDQVPALREATAAARWARRLLPR